MRKLFFACCLVFFALNFSYAQDYQFRTKSKQAIKYFQRGTHYYDNKQYDEAIIELQNALKEDSNFLEAHMLIGDVYTDDRNYAKGVEHYRKAVLIDPEFFPQNFFNLAKIEMLIDEFDSAKTHLGIFLTFKTRTNELRDRAEKMLSVCKFASYAVKHPVPFNPVNMGDNINSTDAEYLPSFTADDQTLVYTRRRLMGSQGGMKDYNEDFFVSKKENSAWNMSVNMGAPINTGGNEGAHCISPDGRYVFFTACNREGYRGCDLYYSKRTGTRWTAPVNMGDVVNSEQWDSQPTIASDGRTIYFLSSRPGGIGKIDIWKTTLDEKGYWSNPENLGPEINTPESEYSPFIHPDNQTLYFASEGHQGMGAADLFYSRMGKEGKFQIPVNMGYPINSGGEETSLFVNASGNTAYFATDRIKDTRGKLDIYSFELYPEARPVAVSYVKGTVKDKGNNTPLEASFEVIDVETGKTVTESFSDKSTGEFLACLPAGKEYALNVSKEGYLFYSDNFNCKNATGKTDAYSLDILLSPAKAGEKIILKNIFFETNSYDLKHESTAELNKVIAFMKKNPKVIIEISGHTDNVGDEKSNLTLSEKRARSVYDAILKGGLESSRLTFKGFGESKPVASNDTDQGRSKNRRTEFTITSVN